MKLGFWLLFIAISIMAVYMGYVVLQYDPIVEDYQYSVQNDTFSCKAESETLDYYYKLQLAICWNEFKKLDKK